MSYLKALFLLFALTTATALSLPDPDTCHLTITRTSQDGSPATYLPQCIGGCAETGGQCTDRSAAGEEISVWWCDCGTQFPNVKCRGEFILYEGAFSISCDQNGCNNQCLKPTLPTPYNVQTNVCTCPDA
jgi:hypothetical protein